MKYKKKEILVIIVILIIVVLLAFSSKIEDAFQNTKEELVLSETDSASKFVTITVTGEILEDNYKIKVKYGSTYGDIAKYIESVSNDYSIYSFDLKKRIFEDTTINIASTDEGLTEYDDTDKICINTASKKSLMLIYGIGEKRSDKIIEYRANKKIESFEELQNLLGVSDAIMEKIKQQAFL